MKKYIDQIFYEGLGQSIYHPIENKINKLKNKKTKKIFTFIVKSIYFIIAIIIAIVLFYSKL